MIIRVLSLPVQGLETASNTKNYRTVRSCNTTPRNVHDVYLISGLWQILAQRYSVHVEHDNGVGAPPVSIGVHCQRAFFDWTFVFDESSLGFGEIVESFTDE